MFILTTSPDLKPTIKSSLIIENETGTLFKISDLIACLRINFPFSVFGDPSTLNCDRSSQGDVFFADMSHSICKSDCLENINEGLLPQKWMGQKILPMLNQNGCDIDEPWQIDMSIRWLKKNNSFVD